MSNLNEVLLVSLILIVFFLPAVPGYVLAKRRGLRAPGLAFIPWVGLWLVVFRSIGWTGSLLALLIVVVIGLPFVGVGVIAWAGIRVPVVHCRSRWWGVALAVPVANLVGYWAYAFTLRGPEAMSAAQARS